MADLFGKLVGVLGSESRARDVLQDMWGAGITLAARSRDPYDVTGVKPPVGMSYQWSPSGDVEKLAASGWQPVPYKRHDGMFAPVGTGGDCEVSGLTLVERRKELVDAEHDKRIAGADKNVDDWIKKNAGEGLTGFVRVGTDESAQPKTVGDGLAVGGTKLPPDMIMHAGDVFAERDRLRLSHYLREHETAEEYGERLTVLAINNVRARLGSAKQETAA